MAFLNRVHRMARGSMSPSTAMEFNSRVSSISRFHPMASDSLYMQVRRITDPKIANDPRNEYQKTLRNIGISAHIDSGKTTLTERILYYTGRIKKIHEVKGKDGVGATMDFMDLEREKGITIQSAATFVEWFGHQINVIDTPGHVDFTIEVERALRVLDGAVLVLCAVSGVQSQTMTVDRQMKRYKVPRLVFINKLDRAGSDPFKVVNQLRTKLHLNAALMQIPIGLENSASGVVDLLKRKAFYFTGDSGETIVEEEVPARLVEMTNAKRQELLERLADGDDAIAEKVLEGVEPTFEELKVAVRKATLAHKFVPVFLGTALKNIGVQLLLDGVVDYLPKPTEANNIALDTNNAETPQELASDSKAPFVGLAFKLEEGRYGQLTYMRVYQGTLSQGDMIYNVNTKKKLKVPRLVKMNANVMEDVKDVRAGDICALFGVECHSGHTFTDGPVHPLVMTSMHVPEPVMSLAVTTKKKDATTSFSKALSRFQKEDPTFRVETDQESGQTIIKGMGELHLEIYLERMKREYNVETIAGKPLVAFRETIGKKAAYEYVHKKQSGGSGQFAKVCGFVEPIPEEDGHGLEFVDATVGGSIPPQFMTACEKGFKEAASKGPLIGAPIVGCRMVVNDGAAHSVDSNEMAFRTATVHAFRTGFKSAAPTILEPIMTVEITAPAEYQGPIIANLNKRRGVIVSSDTAQDFVTIVCEVPLNNMFGYSTDLRSMTQGKGEFTMEYKTHQALSPVDQLKIVEEYQKKAAAEAKDK